MKKDVHVVPAASVGKWEVKVSGNVMPRGTYRTQKEAIERGREIGRRYHSELVVHGRNGQIKRKHSFGNDPRDVKG